SPRACRSPPPGPRGLAQISGLTRCWRPLISTRPAAGGVGSTCTGPAAASTGSKWTTGVPASPRGTPRGAAQPAGDPGTGLDGQGADAGRAAPGPLGCGRGGLVRAEQPEEQVRLRAVRHVVR